jgi:hypothetical protein
VTADGNALKRLREADPEERLQALAKARRSALPGELPLIASTEI